MAGTIPTPFRKEGPVGSGARRPSDLGPHSSAGAMELEAVGVARGLAERGRERWGIISATPPDLF